MRRSFALALAMIGLAFPSLAHAKAGERYRSAEAK